MPASKLLTVLRPLFHFELHVAHSLGHTSLRFGLQLSFVLSANNAHSTEFQQFHFLPLFVSRRRFCPSSAAAASVQN